MDIWNAPVNDRKGAAYLGAGFTIKPTFDTHIGSLKAIDPATRKVVWEYKNKAPLWAGILTTAGNLVFTGTPEGFLKAFDAKTGEEVGTFQIGTGVVASPITWSKTASRGSASRPAGAVPLWGGEVAGATTGISQGGRFWAFKLPNALASR